ncbi:MAG: histidine kinase [Muribaculaceae bacterium]|nr:histidine kinase [Muribaculaceae bacterium]
MLLAFLLFYFPSVLTLLSEHGEPRMWTVTGVVMATFYTVVFCVNYFWLVPWLLEHPEKRSLYFIVNLVLILAVCCLIPIWFEASGGLPLPKGHRHKTITTAQYLIGYLRFIIRDGIMMVLSAALAYALRLSEARERLRRRDLELSAEKRQIELKSLKAQLNPHFLFNSLNNIYALIGFAPERAQTALHDLSNMLRFMIYESGSTAVTLSKEMQFIADYTALMKLRLNSNIKVECDVMEFPPSDIQVTPLLFLTLVENAFKHVAPLPDGKGFIKIKIGIENSQLVGIVSNTFNDSKLQHSADSSESGVGLENVRRQLRLLYPDSHTFTIDKSANLIDQSPNIFTATISIALISLKITTSPNQ